MFNNKNNFLEILCATIYDQGDMGVAKRYGISFFQLVEHISPQRQEKSL
jgi:hypothetical protein